MTCTVRINRDRLWASLMELQQIGAYDDEAASFRTRCLAVSAARVPTWEWHGPVTPAP